MATTKLGSPGTDGAGAMTSRVMIGAAAVVVAATWTTVVAASADVAAVSPRMSSTAVADDGDFAGLVDIGGGRRMYLECRGTGSPTVVFEAGSGNAADMWSENGAAYWSESNPGASGISVLPAVAQLTRVCAYDRPNTNLAFDEPSRSDPVQVPRTLDALVADLHALLSAAEVPGPYVLVGHSMGGMAARLFASTYPDEVAGFVSVDAAYESYYEAYEQLLRSEQYQSPMGEIDVLGAAARMNEARIAQPLHRMPMVVFEHSRDRARFPNPFGLPPDYPIDALEAAFQAAQDDLASLVPGTEHVIADESEHYIQLAQPELVIEAIDAVVEAVRRGETRLGPSALATSGAQTPILAGIAALLVGLGVALSALSRRRGAAACE